MKLLFDTHAFIWWDSEPSRLSSRVLALCQDRTNSLYLSVASVWEMQIKSQLGKLKLNTPLDELVRRQQEV
ncbi:MAG: type II toxin-antitoxin system VapC family toxin, partial [Planctomycetales bacterium]|nr:type II toxin-antitoxin system VapC family toxin [Planctomycetales bacterium]